MIAKPPISILFVCLGNICRSPLAEGVFRHMAEAAGRGGAFKIDSAGTGSWHAGSAPDPRSIAIAGRHGIDISAQRARQVRLDDFRRFHLILGMDRSNVDDLHRLAPPEARDRVHLFLGYAAGQDRDVPDPYYGGADGFAEVYRMIREAAEMLAGKTGWRESAPSSGQASSTI